MQFIYVAFLYGFLLCCYVSGNVSTDSSEDDFEDEDYDYTELNSTSNGTLQFVKELTDMTRDPGKTVRFVCEVKHLDLNTTNPKITITWKKNNAMMEEDKRITIKRFDKPDQQLYKSVLRISRLESWDQSFYECIASNGINKIKSQAILRVPQEKWSSAASSDIPSYKPLYEHEDKHNPSQLGDITTFLPNTGRKVGDEFFSTISNPILPKLSEQTINNPVLFEGAPNVKEKMIGVPIYNESEPFCQLYTGNKCKEFLANRFIFVQPPYSQKNIEEKLENAFLVISQSKDISSSCNKFAQPSLCFSAFPLCVDSVQINTYQKQYINNKYKMITEKDKKVLKDIRNKLSMSLQRICKDDCKLLETELCSTEYAIAKRHPVIGQTLELEECEFLPEETQENSKHCLRLGVTQTVDKDDNCYWDRGDMYRGIKDTSVSGSTCIRWAHQFHIPLSEYPELTGHNYCRNPGGVEIEPFCFVEKHKKQIKEICGIRKCAYILGVYIGASFVGLLLIGISLAYYCCKKRRKGTRALQNITPTAGKNIYGNPGPNSPMEMNTLLPHNIPPQRNHHSNKNGFQNLAQYTYKEVAFIEELGEGAFGKVYKGELKTKAGKIFVAVKSLKENASAKTQADFQREIELISELKHPNIICLLGVVMKQEPMCMLFEFMSEGDLHEFLIANSPNQGKTLSQNQFLQIAIQIAQGMEYLSENHYVHRDLAARNCLVSKDLIVKISDFGLSRDMYSCDYYRVQSKSLLPVRWMPPESILYGKFTTESDVWSYGVVLWEIYSYGLQPYYGYNNQEVINMIRSRKLLPCPEACPGYCYALMVECWAELAIRRPSFGEISHRLRVWKQNGNSAGAYFKQPEVYTNPQKYGHSSKSSHTSDSQTLCPTFENQNDPSSTWERNLKKTSSNKLNESQSSLTSRSSSLGNKTQSTNLSNEHNSRGSRKSADRKSQKSFRNEDLDRHPRNIVVSSIGDNFESKLSH